MTSQVTHVRLRRDERRFGRRCCGADGRLSVVLATGGRLQQRRPVAVRRPDVQLEGLGRRADLAAQAARGRRRRGRRRGTGRQALPRPRSTCLHAVDRAVSRRSVVPWRQRRRQPTTVPSQQNTLVSRITRVNCDNGMLPFIIMVVHCTQVELTASVLSFCRIILTSEASQRCCCGCLLHWWYFITPVLFWEPFPVFRR